MAKTYGPFSSGAGASFTEGQWQTLWSGYDRGVLWGTRNSMSVYADSTGMQVKVRSGTAVLQGFLFDDDVEEILAVTTASATNPRIDRVVVRRDFGAHTMDYFVKAGTPAASPSPPALQRDGVIWELSLAQVFVAANVITIAPGAVTDERTNPEVGGLFEYRMAAIVCNSTTRPSTSLQVGTLIYELDTSLMRFWNGSSWITIPTGSGGSFTNATLNAPTITGTVGGVATYTTPVLDRPFISDYSNAQHAHSSTSQGGTVDHNVLTNRGGNTHSAIDSHIAATTAHGVTSPLIGSTDAQTLSNKTLADPIETGQHAEGTGVIYQAGTINLPAPAQERHRHYKAWGGTLTFTCVSGAVLGPPGGNALAASFTLNPGDSVTMWADGNYWWAL